MGADRNPAGCGFTIHTKPLATLGSDVVAGGCYLRGL
jgi:hypothetical protein